MSKVITPADVLERVEHLYEIVIWLGRIIALLCALIVAKMGINTATLWRTNRLLARVEALLSLTEQHGALGDSKRADQRADATAAATAAVTKSIAPLLQTATAAVSAKVEEIPAKVQAAMREGDSPGSGTYHAPPKPGC